MSLIRRATAGSCIRCTMRKESRMWMCRSCLKEVGLWGYVAARQAETVQFVDQHSEISKSPTMKSKRFTVYKQSAIVESPRASPSHMNVKALFFNNTSPNNNILKGAPSLKKLDFLDSKRTAGSKIVKSHLGDSLGPGMNKSRPKTNFFSGLDIFSKRHTRFYITEQLDQLKNDTNVNPYIRQKISEALNDVNTLNKILKEDGSMHDFIKYIGKGNYNQPCKSKYTPLKNLKVGDFDLEELSINIRDLQAALLKRFESHEKSYLALKASVRKRESIPSVHTSNIRSLEFRNNDQFYSKRQQISDFKPMEAEFSSIFKQHSLDQTAAQRRALMSWRLKKERSEELSLPANTADRSSTGHHKTSSRLLVRKPKNQRHLLSIG